MDVLTRDISHIKDAMINHNKADDERFETIIQNQQESRDIHIRNEETLKQILAQAQRTNGRVTSLEEISVRLDKGNALLHQIVSQQHGQYEKFVIQQEKLGMDFVTKIEFEPIKSKVNGAINVVLVAVGSAILALVGLKLK